MTRQEAAHQLIYDVLVKPTESQNLPRNLSDQTTFETHQMRLYAHERPEAFECRRVAKLWVRWVETQGVVYPRGVQGTWMRIWEIVALMPRVKAANTNYIAQLLALPPPPPPAAATPS